MDISRGISRAKWAENGKNRQTAKWKARGVREGEE